jgi:hypothetical protein
MFAVVRGWSGPHSRCGGYGANWQQFSSDDSTLRAREAHWRFSKTGERGEKVNIRAEYLQIPFGLAFSSKFVMNA